MSAETRPSHEVPPQTLTQKVLTALDGKIADDPFYTGRNAVMWGLSTPINKEDADNLYYGTLIVQQDKDSGIAWRKDGGKIIWKNQPKWAQKWETVGDYLGNEDTLEGVAEKHGTSRQRILQIVDQLVEEAHTYEYDSPIDAKVATEKKPNGLISLNQRINNPESIEAGILMDLQSGIGIKDVLKKYGTVAVSKLRTSIYELMDEDIIPHVSKDRTSKERRDAFIPLSDVDIPLTDKKDLLSAVTLSMLLKSRDDLHIHLLTATLRHLGLTGVQTTAVNKVIDLLREKDEDIVIQPVENRSKNKTIGYYHIHATADIARISEAIKHTDFDKYREKNEGTS